MVRKPTNPARREHVNQSFGHVTTTARGRGDMGRSTKTTQFREQLDTDIDSNDEDHQVLEVSIDPANDNQWLALHSDVLRARS